MMRTFDTLLTRTVLVSLFPLQAQTELQYRT